MSPITVEHARRILEVLDEVQLVTQDEILRAQMDREGWSGIWVIEPD